ncbi:sterol desaturase family protein [Leeia aquatica]|uniref:Sterol desaturase family protein n=1 Tax=Leeia aquatica TaxID=2725557 RepID=A0A847SDX3_9NEIS|nr:sterol desaturase family protein [Leeia aquatica]NLR75378.1 sterol desaturase family protein [Leeia aquatica]
MDTRLIALAAPLFVLLMLLEAWLSHRRGQQVYRSHDAISSISLGLLSVIANVLTASLGLAAYQWVSQLAPLHLPASAAWVWLLAFVLFDFCYYWHHRLGHTIALLWAAHSVHHQSEDYNLSTALRQPSTTFLFGWLFYLPMALLGIPVALYGAVYSLNLLYQFWIHTELVGRLGWLDRVFGSPSNHRVHHGQNAYCLDRNYGGFLMLWDHLFGTYVDERADEAPIYGVRGALHSWHPLVANLKVYLGLLRTSLSLTRWRDKLQVWLRPPGWTPQGIDLSWDPTAFRKHDPVLPGAWQAYAWAQFGLCYLSGLLWLVRWPGLGNPVGTGVLVAVLLGVLSLGFWLSQHTWAHRLEAGRLLLTAGMAWFTPPPVRWGVLALLGLQGLWLLRISARSSAAGQTLSANG